jgi:type IV secretory pathway VirB10-like protein
MSHIVVYQTDGGSSGFEQCSSLEDAIVIAERMRNVDGVETPRIFRMEEVEIDFRPYYRVQVSGDDSESPELEDLPAPPSAEAVAAAEAETGGPVTADVSAWADDSEAGATDHIESDEAEDTSEESDTAASHDSDDEADDHDNGDHGHDDHDHGDHGHDHDDHGQDDAESGVEMQDAPVPEEKSDDSSDEDDAMISVRRGLFGR